MIKKVVHSAHFWNVVYLFTGILIVFVALTVIHPLSIKNILQRPMYNLYALNDRFDPVVKEITEYCAPFKGEAQVDCVVTKVHGFYNYNLTNATGIIKTPSQVKETGGICRDYSVMYGAIFLNLGYHADYLFMPTHVFNYIYTDNLYCTVDQTIYDCSYIGSAADKEEFENGTT